VKASIRKHHKARRSLLFKEQYAYVRQASLANRMAQRIISQIGMTGDRNILPSLYIARSLHIADFFLNNEKHETTRKKFMALASIVCMFRFSMNFFRVVLCISL